MKASEKSGARAKGAVLGKGPPLELAAIGMESEFSLVVDGRTVKPEDLFSDPRSFLKQEMMHREGSSFHLPTGGAVYFDTGVIEVATPVIEIERGCSARAGRSLWEGILAVRRALDGWQEETRRSCRLVGFSTHYNISFELPESEQRGERSVEQLAHLLVHILPVPVMLLATNRRSTGVGVRPRGDRIEITADFTPSAALMIATGTVVTGITREVMKWPTYSLTELDRRGLPVIESFEPAPHTSRKGWLARKDGYNANPFAHAPDRAMWEVRPSYFAHTGVGAKLLSLRQIARSIVDRFYDTIRHLSDPFTMRLIDSVMTGRAPSLLDLDERPKEYEDVGRLCVWDNLFPEAILSRSRYERVLIRAISGRRLILQGDTYLPVGVRGWTQVVFRRAGDGSEHRFTFDYLLDHLEAWERRR